jgi:signal transduction histidine kinase
MGAIIIAAILITYFTANAYAQEPEIAALIVLVVAAFLFILGHNVIYSFERLAEASRAKSEFVSIMSHQLRSPLSAIKWQLDLFKGKSVKFNEGELKELQEFFSGLDEENERMIRIINDLLDLNRIEDKVFHLDISAFSLKEVIEEAVKKREQILKERNIPVAIVAPEHLPFILADKPRIRNVINNFLDNAIFYSPEGGQIAITLEELPKFIRFSISDQGIGISKEESKKIFKKFFRGEKALGYHTDGLGVRLYLSKIIIEALSGEIGFSSERQKGSTFWFTLPHTISKNAVK